MRFITFLALTLVTISLFLQVSAIPGITTRSGLSTKTPFLDTKGDPSFAITPQEAKPKDESLGSVCKKMFLENIGWVWPAFCSGAVYGVANKVMQQASYSAPVATGAALGAFAVTDKLIAKGKDIYNKWNSTAAAAAFDELAEIGPL